MNKLLNNYVYYTSNVILNDKKIPIKTDYIYYCFDFEEQYNGIHDLYLIKNIHDPDILFWAYSNELVAVPQLTRRSLEIIYGSYFK